MKPKHLLSCRTPIPAEDGIFDRHPESVGFLLDSPSIPPWRDSGWWACRTTASAGMTLALLSHLSCERITSNLTLFGAFALTSPREGDNDFLSVIRIFGPSDLPFDSAQGGELVEPFRNSCFGFRIYSV